MGPLKYGNGMGLLFLGVKYRNLECKWPQMTCFFLKKVDSFRVKGQVFSLMCLGRWETFLTARSKPWAWEDCQEENTSDMLSALSVSVFSTKPADLWSLSLHDYEGHSHIWPLQNKVFVFWSSSFLSRRFGQSTPQRLSPPIFLLVSLE